MKIEYKNQEYNKNILLTLIDLRVDDKICIEIWNKTKDYNPLFIPSDVYKCLSNLDKIKLYELNESQKYRFYTFDEFDNLFINGETI